MNYDEAIKRLQDIVAQLENEEAISVEDYKKMAEEAQKLLVFCRNRLSAIEEDLGDVLENEA